MVCIRFFGIQIMDILQVKRTRYLAKFLQRNANAMSDNHKEYVYAIIAKYDRHNRTIDSHVRIRMSEKTAMDAYRAWVKTLKGKIPEVYKL